MTDTDNPELAFELPNVGAGENPLSLQSLAADRAFVMLLFQRDYHCTNCRSQIQEINERYEAFRKRNVEVVSIVPEPPERLKGWQDRYELQYPLCADPESAVSEQYDQPVRFGLLGSLSDFLGRMPKVVLLDCRDTVSKIVYSQEGSSTWDRPTVEELLAVIDDHAES